MLRIIRGSVLVALTVPFLATGQSEENAREPIQEQVAAQTDARKIPLDIALNNLREAILPLLDFAKDNQAEHHDNWHHGWNFPAPTWPSIPIPGTPYGGNPWQNLRPVFPTLPPLSTWPPLIPQEWDFKQHLDPHRASMAMLGAKEAYLDYLQNHLDKDFLDALFNLLTVKTELKQSGNVTSRFEAKELAALRTARVFNEHLPRCFEYRPGVKLAAHYAELSFWENLPRGDGERARIALRRAVEYLVATLYRKPADLPEFLNAAYQTYINALPPTIPLVDALVAACIRCEDSLTLNKPALLFAAIEQLALAWNFAFPADPEDLVKAKIAAEEAFWEHFPKDGELPSLLQAIDDGSITAALEAAKETWIKTAPPCLASLFVGVFLDSTLDGNWHKGIGNAATVYFAALERLLKEHWKLKEVLKRAELRAAKVYHEILGTGWVPQIPLPVLPTALPPVLPPIMPPIWPLDPTESPCDNPSCAM